MCAVCVVFLGGGRGRTRSVVCEVWKGRPVDLYGVLWAWCARAARGRLRGLLCDPPSLIPAPLRACACCNHFRLWVARAFLGLQGPHWAYLGSKLHTEALASLLCGPWKGRLFIPHKNTQESLF